MFVKEWNMRGAIILFSCLLATVPLGAVNTVPTDIKLTGTQQLEVPTYTSPENCDNCHGGYDQAVEPEFMWRGGMMGNATRDPIFWATLAVAEQDFLPGSDPATRGGAGDLCIRCHSVNGWMGDRSTPTDGSTLAAGDVNGVECEFCHLMVDPDQPLSIAGTTEVQNFPFEAYDATDAYRGAAQYVMNGNGTRLGPYATSPPHAAIQSPFHRKTDLCATCHDVSNPAVGDLAPGNGAQAGMALAPGTYSGAVGTPVAGKAAFNNAPHKYGIVERTYSEWVAGTLDTFEVDNFSALPADLKATGGALQVAHARASAARGTADYEDGTIRYYTCQTCHMSPATGKGCNKNGFPVRTDLPTHDQTGAGYWMPDVVQYQNTKGTLRMGGGLTQRQKDALNAGKVRAQAMLQSAGRVSGTQVGNNLMVRVTNLTAHKLLSGYPEGRRLWINVRWYDSGNNLIKEDGGFDNIGRTVADKAGVQHQVQSILDPEHTVIYEAGMGMDQAWASSLVSLGYSPSMVLSWNRMTDAAEHTLGELAGSPAGTQFHTFHFVLNNVVVEDHRIPPYGFMYDEAKARNALPVPATLFGNPGPGGTYNYWDERAFPIPNNAASAQIRLYYQQTSWEYIQFLWKQNDGLSPFLGQEGINMLDAWLNTGQNAPLQMAVATVSGLVPPVAQPPGEASHQTVRAELMHASLDPVADEIVMQYMPACGTSGHNIYYGSISALAGPDAGWYSGVVCSPDTAGLIRFPAPAGNAFFLVVGNNGTEEGGYGYKTGGAHRPEAAGLGGGCDYPRNLVGGCD
jgi:hypothetical protein